jgi:hypothetical protein
VTPGGVAAWAHPLQKEAQVKTDAAVERTILLAGITPHAATLGGVLVIVALACGLAIAFAVLMQHFVVDDTAYGASSTVGSNSTPTVQTGAEPDRWLDGRTSLTLPHVVDRWSDEPTAVD